MATVRELVTKIKFVLDGSKLQQATKEVNNFKSKVNSANTELLTRYARKFWDISTSAKKAGNDVEYSMNKASRAIDRANRSASSGAGIGGKGDAGGLTGTLKGGLAGLVATIAGGALVGSIKSAADEVMNLDGRLRIVTQSEQERLNIEDKLYSMSQKNRQQMTSLGDLYFKVARGAAEYGVTQEQVLRVTDVVSKSMTVGGASTQEAQATILQLGQALGSGRLQGDELRSLDENASQLMKHVAEYYGTTVGGLKEMGAKGLLTSESLIQALLASGTAVDSEFNKMPKTIGQAMTQGQNLWMRFIQYIERDTGVFSVIADGISSAFSWIDQNLFPMLDRLGEFINGIRNNKIDNPYWREFFGWLQNVWKKIEPQWDKFTNGFTRAGTSLKNLIKSIFGFDDMSDFKSTFKSLDPIIILLTDDLKQMGDMWDSVGEFIAAISPLVTFLAKVVGGVLYLAFTGLLSIINVLFRVASEVFSGIANEIQWCASQLADFINWVDMGIAKLQAFFGISQQASGGATRSWVDKTVSDTISNSWSTDNSVNTYNFTKVQPEWFEKTSSRLVFTGAR